MSRYDRVMARVSGIGGLILTGLFLYALMITEAAGR